MRRRSFLATATVASASLAGCFGGGPSGAEAGDDPEGRSTPGTEPGARGSSPPRSLPAHPATTDLGNAPHLGPAPTAATKLIVAFADPSCPTCRRFESRTFPKVRSTLVEERGVSYVFRVYPHVRPWATLACQALFAVHERDPAAFWALKDHYFAAQESFTPENVLPKTRGWLAANTTLDADAVVADAEAGAFADAIDVDVRAGEEAKVEGTPTFFLFRGGEYLTTVRGSQGYEVFANALGE